MSDLVSVIMPSYNTAKYIKESIESVLSQTYTNWELLIVDDCSTDNTDGIVNEIEDKRIRYIKNTSNCGAAVCRNKALKEAKGKWIAFLDSDDLWMPDKLQKQIEFMKLHEYHFSYTNYCEIDENSCRNGRHITGPKVIGKAGMYNYCWPGCLTVMYDAEYVGMIQVEDIKKNNDYAMWLKVCKKAKCYLLNQQLAMYRKRNGSISNHSYYSLIRWHFKLFHEVEKMSRLTSLIYTMRNMFFGICKKMCYVKTK